MQLPHRDLDVCVGDRKLDTEFGALKNENDALCVLQSHTADAGRHGFAGENHRQHAAHDNEDAEQSNLDVAPTRGLVVQGQSQRVGAPHREPERPLRYHQVGMRRDASLDLHQGFFGTQRDAHTQVWFRELSKMSKNFEYVAIAGTVALTAVALAILFSL